MHVVHKLSSAELTYVHAMHACTRRWADDNGIKWELHLLENLSEEIEEEEEHSNMVMG